MKKIYKKPTLLWAELDTEQVVALSLPVGDDDEEVDDGDVKEDMMGDVWTNNATPAWGDLWE